MSVTAAETPASVVGRTQGVAEGREFILMVTALMAMGALAIDMMLPAFKEMRAEFGMEPGSSRVTWVITAFFLGLSVGPWFFGPPSDRFGRRRTLRIGIMLYMAAAIVAALAPSFGLLVVARFFWGIAAGAPRAITLAMIRDRYAGEEMARLMSMIMGTFILVPILAPAFGAGLMKLAPWRIVLWTPVAVAGLILIWAKRLPETLSEENRRTAVRGDFKRAVKAVVTTRETVYFGLAVAFLFAVMSGYLASSEVIVDRVYDSSEWFPLIFGVVAISMGAASLTSARFVRSVGLYPLVRRIVTAGFLMGLTFCALLLATGGKPPIVVLVIGFCLFVPIIQSLVPNCNTAAMVPLPHVAGTGSAILGSISTAGGALLGNRLTSTIDQSVTPFLAWSTLSIGIAGLLIFRATRATPTPISNVLHKDRS